MDEQSSPVARIFALLRQLRQRAELTQDQVAAALGLTGKARKSVIHRLECGKFPNPSLRLVLDVLRVCRATSSDVVSVLDEYLARPLAVPESARAGKPRTPKPVPEDPAVRALRRAAADWTLRQVVEKMLHFELNKLRAQPGSPDRRYAVLFGRQTFRVLLATRTGEAAARERRLIRNRKTAAKRGLSTEAVAYLEARVRDLFTEMERDGDLEWLPTGVEAEQRMNRSGRRMLETDAMMCRIEMRAAQQREYEEAERTKQPIKEAAEKLLVEAGIHGSDLGNYRGFVTAFYNVARSTIPGSAARANKLADMLRYGLKKHHNRTVVDRLAELVFQLYDTRAIQPDKNDG